MSDDGSLKEDSVLSYWSRLITEASVDYNRPIPYHTEYLKMFQQAGFVDIKQITLKSPTNPWPKDKRLKEVGKFQLLAHTEGLEGISIGLLTRARRWKADEVSVLMAQLRPELKDRSIHSYQTKLVLVASRGSLIFRHVLIINSVVVVGRKPDIPRTPDSLRDGMSYGWGAGASTSSKD